MDFTSRAREFRLIREDLAPESRRFLVKQGHHAVVAELDLSSMDDALAVLSGRTATVELLDRIRAEVGDDPAVWMPLFQQQRKELRMMRPRPASRSCLQVPAAHSPPRRPHAQVAVFDPSVFARQFEQLTEMRKQVETLTSQLKVAQDQLGQAKQLYDSFNKLTNVNDIASLLNSSEFRKILPSDFSQIEGLIKGTGSGGFSSAIDSYLRNNRYYTQNAGNSFYASELERIARQTGTKQSIGQAVYDTASKRIDELEKLRQQISASKDVKDVLDLSARFQAEQALLQNDVLRMQGLAMVQRAQRRHGSRSVSANVRRQLIDEMKSCPAMTRSTFLVAALLALAALQGSGRPQRIRSGALPFSKPALQPRARTVIEFLENPRLSRKPGRVAATTRAGSGTRRTVQMPDTRRSA